jgi:hypothetical protein
MACDEIGAYQGPKAAFVAAVVNLDPDGGCQKEQVGKTSPGPVQDEEILGRFVFSPAHLTKVEPKNLDESIVDDAFKFGASVNRIQVESKEFLDELHLKGEAMAEGVRNGNGERPPQPERRYLGLLRFVARDVREINVKLEYPRARVYDTSLEHDSLHGDIVADITLANGVLEKVIKKDLRTRLFLAITASDQSGFFISPHNDGGVETSSLGVKVLPELEF